MMKKIEVLEELATKETKYSEVNVNSTFGAAYFYSKEAGNDLMNFAEVIWDYDIDAIIENCRRFGISEFTISSTFSSLILMIGTLALKAKQEKKEFQHLRSAFHKRQKPGGPEGLFGRSNIHNNACTCLSDL